MAIANQIAQYGMNTGNNIQNTVSNAFARIENNRRYEQEQSANSMIRQEDQRRYNTSQDRLSQQDELQNKMMQTQAQALADEKERKYAANGYEVMSQLPPEKRSMAWQQWIQTGVQQGIDMQGVPTQYDDSLLQKLAFQGGDVKSPKQLTPTKLERMFNLRDSLPENDPRIKTVDAAIAKETSRGKGTSFSVGPDGAFNFTQGGDLGPSLGNPDTLNKETSKKDATQIQDSREASNKAEASRNLLSRAREILPQIETSKAAGFTKFLNQGLSMVGSARAEERAALLEEYDAISKELGAQSLQLFGGSDTEKELEVAIRTNPELNKTNTANERITQRKLRAIEVLQSRPDFESQWLQRNGSLINPDANTGEYFGKAWRRYQKESFGETASASGGVRQTREGATAINPATGEKLTYRGGQWTSQ